MTRLVLLLVAGLVGCSGCAQRRIPSSIADEIGYLKVPDTRRLLRVSIGARAALQIAVLWDSAMARGREDAACVYAHLIRVSDNVLPQAQGFRPPYYRVVVDSVRSAEIAVATDSSLGYYRNNQNDPGCPERRGYLGRVHTHFPRNGSPVYPWPGQVDLWHFSDSGESLTLVVWGHDVDGTVHMAYAFRNPFGHGQLDWRAPVRESQP